MEESVIDLRGLLGLLRRQFRLILITTVVGVMLAGVAAFSMTPIFSATALLLIDPSSKNLLNPDLQVAGSLSDNARIDSEVEIIKSDNVLSRVAADLNLVTSQGAAQPGWREQIMIMLRLAEPRVLTPDDLIFQALSSVRNAVSVQRRGATFLIAVSARSASPTAAATLANAVVKAYIDDQVQSKVDSVMAARDVLDARTEQARASIVENEGSFDRFVSDNINDIARTTGRPDLAQTHQQIQDLIAARDRTSTLVSTVERELAAGNIDAIVDSLQSEALNTLERERTALQEQVGDGEASASIRDQLAALDESLRTTAEQQVADLRGSIQTSQNQEQDLRQSLRSALLDSQLSPETLTQLYEMQQGANIARTQYENLLARTRDLDTQASLQMADSRVVSNAMAPQSPSFPNRALIIMVAAVIALGIGVGLALVYENLIGGFTSDAQMQSVLRRPVAAVVPLQKTKDGKTPANLVTTAPLSVFSEGVRRVRAAIEQSVKNRPDKDSGVVVMVTSSVPSEGKTTLALAVARSVAVSGRSTLLIDCDLRKPSVHQQLDLQPSKGLLEYLRADDADARRLGDITSHDTLTRATVIVGSRRSHLPTDQLLDGSAFGNLIRAARNSFEVIILDTPPIEPVVDGLYLAALADAIVVVTRWASTPQSLVRKSIAQLTASKAEDTALLLVLNQQHDTLRSQRSKYSDYYSDAE